MATSQQAGSNLGNSAIDLDSLTPDRAWELWKPVSDEYIRRIKAGEETAVDMVAAEMGVPLEVSDLVPRDEEEEAEAHEWVEALIGDVGDEME